ncbi:MAG: hypothetical protein ACPGNV_01170 [Mangrovicoccus sp.]
MKTLILYSMMCALYIAPASAARTDVPPLKPEALRAMESWSVITSNNYDDSIESLLQMLKTVSGTKKPQSTCELGDPGCF